VPVKPTASGMATAIMRAAMSTHIYSTQPSPHLKATHTISSYVCEGREPQQQQQQWNETFELATDLGIVKFTGVVVVVVQSVCAASSSHQSAAAVVLHTESAGFSSGLASEPFRTF
jgi:hypothetical protein